MSGPKTAIFQADPMSVLLAYATIQAVNAVAEGYAEAAALRQQHNDKRDADEQRLNDAATAGLQALNAEGHTAREEFEHLANLADTLGLGEKVRAIFPAMPASANPQDEDAVAAHAHALQVLNTNLRTMLLTEAARQSIEFAEQPFDSTTAAAKSIPQQISKRQLARIAHLRAIPEQIAKLALELDQTLPGERADLLATELRAQVQAWIELHQKKQVQQATAAVLEHTLHELGYQVEALKETLFVEGGMMHFRRAGWGNYMVRLRVDAKADTVNFNVVRAVTESDNERSVLDHLAEDRWCSEFPALLRALEAQGVHMNVTRHLAAGELPVQFVDAAKLPAFADEEAATSNLEAQTMSRPLP
ncbi:MAG TPA: hypothetical protein VF472_07870 [Burkholderiaceae bacterium]